MPRILGLLFILAGFGYLVESVGIFLLPAHETMPTLVVVVIAIAEITFPIWLFVKAVNTDRHQERVASSVRGYST